jgi:hypothetical protein
MNLKQVGIVIDGTRIQQGEMKSVIPGHLISRCLIYSADYAAKTADYLASTYNFPVAIVYADIFSQPLFEIERRDPLRPIFTLDGLRRDVTPLSLFILNSTETFPTPEDGWV